MRSSCNVDLWRFAAHHLLIAPQGEKRRSLTAAVRAHCGASDMGISPAAGAMFLGQSKDYYEDIDSRWHDFSWTSPG
jgi:hypothetical protein